MHRTTSAAEALITIVCVLIGAAALCAAPITLLPGCATSVVTHPDGTQTVEQTIDWQRVAAICNAAAEQAEVYRDVLPEHAETIADVRDALEIAAESAQRLDAAEAELWIDQALLLAHVVVSRLPDEDHRRIGLAAIGSVRLALAVAGLEDEPVQEVVSE